MVMRLPGLQRSFHLMPVHPPDGELLPAYFDQFTGIGLYLIERYDIAAMNTDKTFRRKGAFNEGYGLPGDDPPGRGDYFAIILQAFNIDNIIQGDLLYLPVGTEMDESFACRFVFHRCRRRVR